MGSDGHRIPAITAQPRLILTSLTLRTNQVVSVDKPAAANEPIPFSMDLRGEDG